MIYFLRSPIHGGESVCFATDDARLNLDANGMVEGAVVYRESEIRTLREIDATLEFKLFLHEVKREFGTASGEATLMPLDPQYQPRTPLTIAEGGEVCTHCKGTGKFVAFLDGTVNGKRTGWREAIDCPECAGTGRVGKRE